MVRVAPIQQRASWARQRTAFDEVVEPSDMQARPAHVAKRRMVVEVEIDDTDTALDRVCRALTNADARIVKVGE